MNRNLFLNEMRRNALTLILWVIIVTFLISLTMSVFRTFLENQSKILGMLNLVPKSVQQFKGISNFNDMLSALGFYAVNNIIYMMVLGSIFAIVLSSNILLKEEYNKTAEYLLTRPLTRSEIFLSKSAIVFINVFLLNLITALGGLICIMLVKTAPFSIKAFFTLSLYTFLLNLLFGVIGLFLSTIVKRSRPITAFCIGLVLIFYFIYTISKITESISKIGYLSPFKYVDLNVTSQGYKPDLVNLAYFIGLSLLFYGLSFRFYLRRDIYT
jgi:ABC-2 type transport system permease protein